MFAKEQVGTIFEVEFPIFFQIIHNPYIVLQVKYDIDCIKIEQGNGNRKLRTPFTKQTLIQPVPTSEQKLQRH
jgi:hypothetical protein